MAALFGAGERSYVPGYSSVAAERWGHLAYRKQILGPAENTDSFDGSCSLQGDVTFTPPATNSPAALVYGYDATGTCTGHVDGRAVSGAPVRLHDSGPAYGSCQRAMTTAPGQGALTFAGGETIRFTLDFTSVGTEVDGTVYGDRSGSAGDHSTFATQRTTPDVVLQCGGKGAAKVPMDMSITTDSPLVSERPAQGTTPSSTSSTPTNAALRLSVRPRSVKVDRRTAFVFRVVVAGGQPAPGAVVRFAGRRARTGPTGAARIVARPRRPGRLAARAAKPGFSAARATIRVRRR
jgi:hypothetical protein